jgi:hypothetical protein
MVPTTQEDLTGRYAFEQATPVLATAFLWTILIATPAPDEALVAGRGAVGEGMTFGVRGAGGRGAVPGNLARTIRLGQQGKHIPGHNNYIPGRSPLTAGIDPQELLNGVHSGQYPIIRMTREGRAIVNFGKPIGTYEGTPTQYGIIHSGSKGAHIVPANPTQY